MVSKHCNIISLSIPCPSLIPPCPSLSIPSPSLCYPYALPWAYMPTLFSMYNLCHPLPYPCPYLAPTKPIKIFYLCISHYIEVNPHQRHHKSVTIPYISTITRFFLLNYKKPQNKCWHYPAIGVWSKCPWGQGKNKDEVTQRKQCWILPYISTFRHNRKGRESSRNESKRTIKDLSTKNILYP